VVAVGEGRTVVVVVGYNGGGVPARARALYRVARYWNARAAARRVHMTSGRWPVVPIILFQVCVCVCVSVCLYACASVRATV